MQKGLILQDDADLMTAIAQGQEVEVRIGGEVDYCGKLMSFTAKTILTDDWSRYLREVAEIKTV